MWTDWSYSTLMTSSTPNFQIPSVISAFIVGRPFWDSIWQQPDVCIICHSLYNHIADQTHKGYYKLGGWIPWMDIAENLSHHLSKRSQADSDHWLEEPSHMKSDGVDAWLKHWLKLQKKNKHPLVLKRPLDKILDTSPTCIRFKVEGKKGKGSICWTRQLCKWRDGWSIGQWQSGGGWVWELRSTLQHRQSNDYQCHRTPANPLQCIWQPTHPAKIPCIAICRQ